MAATVFNAFFSLCIFFAISPVHSCPKEWLRDATYAICHRLLSLGTHRSFEIKIISFFDDDCDIVCMCLPMHCVGNRIDLWIAINRESLVAIAVRTQTEQWTKDKEISHVPSAHSDYRKYGELWRSTFFRCIIDTAHTYFDSARIDQSTQYLCDNGNKAIAFMVWVVYYVFACSNFDLIRFFSVVQPERRQRTRIVSGRNKVTFGICLVIQLKYLRDARWRLTDTYKCVECCVSASISALLLNRFVHRLRNFIMCTNG